VEAMSKFQPGNNANPKGRPKTAYRENFDQLMAKKKMFDEASQILSERWSDIYNSMCDCAEAGNVQAATFVSSYVLGKPKETVVHDITDDAKGALKLSYAVEAE
jgi:hypothetical protein